MITQMRIIIFQMLLQAWEKSPMMFNLEIKLQRDGVISKQLKMLIETIFMTQQTSMPMRKITRQTLQLELMLNTNS